MYQKKTVRCSLAGYCGKIERFECRLQKSAMILIWYLSRVILRLNDGPTPPPGSTGSQTFKSQHAMSSCQYYGMVKYFVAKAKTNTGDVCVVDYPSFQLNSNCFSCNIVPYDDFFNRIIIKKHDLPMTFILPLKL